MLDRYTHRLGEVALVPSGGGAFEVIVDGTKIYSKLEIGRFPSEQALLEEIETKV